MIGLSPTQVKIWFQNHRYKAKKGDKDGSDETQTEATGRGQARHLLGLMPLGHVKTERSVLAGYDVLPPPSRISITARIPLDNEVGGRTTTYEGETNSPMADNISDISSTGVTTHDTELAAATGRDAAAEKYLQSNDMSYVVPTAASNNAESDSSVNPTSQDWVQFSDQFPRFQYQQQHQQIGGGASLTELKPFYIGGLGSAAVSASVAPGNKASSLTTAGAGGGYLSMPPGSFGFQPSYFASAYGSYAAATEPSTSSHALLTDTGRTW